MAASPRAVPVLDFSPMLPGGTPEGRATLARQWDEAFSTAGFAMIVNHGADETAALALKDAASGFFKQPFAEKMQWHHGAYGMNGGYTPQGMESVARSTGAGSEGTPPDLVENYVFRQSGGDPGADSPAFAVAGPAYFAQMRLLCGRMMELSAAALGLPADFFEDTYGGGRGEMHLRLAHYPPMLSPADPGQLRYGAHTDYTGFTILRQDDEVSGLEVRLPGSDEWRSVEPLPGALVINCGDLIQQWTNDRWHSTWHRVANPAPEAAGKARLSVVMFTGPANDTLIEPLPSCCGPDNPPRYAPVTAGDHLRAKLERGNA